MAELGDESELKKHKLSDDRCCFYMQDKGRICKQQRQKGSDFCVHHLPSERAAPTCPFCGSAIKPDHIKKHVDSGKCPAAVQALEMRKQVFYNEDCNAGSDEEIDLEGMPEESEVERVLNLLQNIKETIKPKDDFKFIKEVEEKERGYHTDKHYQQHRAIVSHLEEILKSDPNAVFVEMGAGKGFLSKFVADHTELFSNRSFVVVDYGRFKNKADTALRRAKVPIHRVPIDLRHLNLSAVEIVNRASSLIVCAKHLCGRGSDYSLRALSSFEHSHPGQIKAICLATCCHGVCSWTAYTGKSALARLGLGPTEFRVLVRASAWATTYSTSSSEAAESDPSRMRRELGLYSKWALDWGRSEYLKSMFPSAHRVAHVRYIEDRVTPENHLITVHMPL
jgi:hypothetical protein